MPDEEIEGKLIGKIVHYFDHIQVAVIELTDKIKAGETVRIIGGDTDFEQVIDSMETDHKKIDQAKKGDEVGFKVGQKVRDGYRVYKV